MKIRWLEEVEFPITGEIYAAQKGYEQENVNLVDNNGESVIMELGNQQVMKSVSLVRVPLCVFEILET